MFSVLSVALILLSVGTSCAGTLPQFSEGNGTSGAQVQPAFFTVVDNFCGIWFSLELLLRVVFCPNKWAFFKQPMNWIDALSVLPFYLRLAVPTEKVLVDALLVFRLLRLFRFFRLLYGLQVLLHTLKACSYELGLLLLILFIPVILFSAVIYYVERRMDSRETKFRSIPESFWWSLITMTTVGYGDMTPKTWLGKIFGGACAICGVLVVALPISIIGSSFNLYYAYAQARLKLPRKKNRVLLNALATSLPSRATSFPSRRGAVRRRSPGTSGSDDTPPVSQRASYQGRLSGLARSYNHEARSSCTWSVASQRSSGGEFPNDIRTSPKAKRKLSRERKISRSERSPPKLDDLPERDEIEELNRRNGALSPHHLFRQSFGGSPNASPGEAPPWSETNGATPRARSYSVPSQPQRTISLRPPRKSRSDSSNLCQHCLLPRKEEEEARPADTTPLCEDTCRCPHGTTDEPRSSTFTVFIPGVRENIQVSSESLPSYGVELPLNGVLPIQLDIVPITGRRESGTSHQDEAETITSDLDSDVELDLPPRASRGGTPDGGRNVPMVYIDMPRTDSEILNGISGPAETRIWIRIKLIA